ncbi:MAG: hypothetical protein ABSB97_01020 [Thermoplasmata archaeon]|jgi:hypothetical protein
MVCRNDTDDPRKCERCGAFLWVAEEGLFCGDCGVLMPCTMQVRPPPSVPYLTATTSGVGDAASGRQ